MKTFEKVEQVFEIESKFYKLDHEDKKLHVGTILYDSRKTDFIKLETEKDYSDYCFVAPELYAIMKEFKI